MLNQVIIVGRLVADPVVNEEDDKKVSKITIAVPRSYKNEDGIYDTDFVDVILWNGIAQNTTDYCHKGDVIGIRGRLETKNNEDHTKELLVVADKVTFLSSKKEDE